MVEQRHQDLAEFFAAQQRVAIELECTDHHGLAHRSGACLAFGLGFDLGALRRALLLALNLLLQTARVGGRSGRLSLCPLRTRSSKNEE